jgi:hypothetical protein
VAPPKALVGHRWPRMGALEFGIAIARALRPVGSCEQLHIGGYLPLDRTLLKPVLRHPVADITRGVPWKHRRVISLLTSTLGLLLFSVGLGNGGEKQWAGLSCDVGSWRGALRDGQ